LRQSDSLCDGSILKRKEETEMAIIQWQSEPSTGSIFDRLRGDVDRLFNLYSPESEPFFSRVYPALNLTEDENHFYVRAELPGLQAQDLDISVVEGQLLIRGERKIAMAQHEGSYHRREREGGVFRRTIAMPASVAGSRVAATIKNGILTVALPKSEESKPRKVAVQTT
jgi:HSP20 family protein